jgi:hypothetical protein
MVKSARILILLFLLGSGTDLFSQQLSHQVLVPLAGVIKAGSVDYSQTIGETAVEVFTATDIVFTQGFQQPCMQMSKENPPPGNGVKVFPNPVTDMINIELFGEGSRTFIIDIINISGTIVRSEKLDFPDKFWQIEHFNVEQFSRGLFFVRVISGDGLISRTFKIDKM